MPSQNINNYYFNRYDIKLDYSSYFDLTLASDERDYDEEVVFSNNIIGVDDGNRLPVSIDLNSFLSNQKLDLLWNVNYTGNTLVSKNYYNPNNEDLNCKTATTVCDIGLVGTDNGLYDKMSGQSLTFTMGINDFEKFNPHYYDRRLKLHPVTSYADWPNHRFSGNSKTIYNIVSKSADTIGYYNELYGGFYQGFYKLYGYDYEVFPERVNKGWTMETVIKPRQREEYEIQPSEVYLNDVYPDNAGTFFFFGTRAENKYYHPASGDVQSINTFKCDFGIDVIGEVTDWTYDRVTSGLTNCIKTCACANTGVTNSNCFNVFPTTATTVQHNIGTCGGYNTEVTNPPVDPGKDVFSNAMAIRLSGDPKNPHLCVKYIKLTGDCVTTGSCETTGLTYSSGYCVNEICSTRGIYDSCDYDSLVCYTANTEERWVMISAVFERYETLEDCDLINWGGLGDIRELLYPSSINGASPNLIMPPQTHPGSSKEKLTNITELNRKWLREKDKRKGLLKLYVNGYLFMVIEDFEEIIPRELNTQKEKQLGVPFNVSWGGGTQGLRESLMFSGCSATEGPYIQDPESMPNEVLSGTSLSGLTTDILLEPNFGGTFMGGISQFRMYTEPLSTPQIQHNTRILKGKFDLYDFWCSNCYPCLLGCFFNFNIEEAACNFDFVSNEITCDFGFNISEPDCNPNFDIIT
jgi:hypothetical protein